MTGENWRETTLGDVCDEVNGIIQTGPFGSQLHQSDYSDVGIPVVMPKDIVEGRINTGSVARVSMEHIERLSRHKLESGDIVYGRRGDIGRQALIRPEQAGWMCGTGCLRLSLGDSVVDPLFLHNYLRQDDVVRWITNQAVGATMPNLNTGILRSVPLRFPTLPIQQRIAGILSAYDKLIENSQRRIRILESIARALYREWFVHFRFPGHESVALVPSPLGEIPEGWEVKRLGDIVEIKKGRNITKKTIRPGDVPVVAGGLAPAYFHDTPNTKRPVITVSASGANAGFVNLYHLDIWASDCSFIDKSSTPYIYYFYLWLDYRRAELTHLQRGSAQPHVYPKDLAQLQAINIPAETLGRFTKNVTPIYEQISNLLLRIENLRTTRDLLLPRLLSGQIDVSALSELVAA
jgi:type I restriction enzyme S subunit